MPELQALEKYITILDGGVIKIDFISDTDSYNEIKKMLRGKKASLKEKLFKSI